MEEYTIRAGDTISGIAASFGMPWRDLWDHESNAALVSLRGKPERIRPGDTLKLPQRQARVEPALVGRRNAFRYEREPEFLRLRVMGAEGARADLVCSLEVGSIRVAPSSSAGMDALVTDAEGFLTWRGRREITLPPRACSGLLVVGSGAEQTFYPLVFHDFAPTDQESGVRQRLDAIYGPPQEQRHGAGDRLTGLREQLPDERRDDADVRNLLDQMCRWYLSQNSDLNDGSSVTYPVLRRTSRGDTGYDTVEDRPRLYANCGRWQNGQTDFLVLSGGEAVFGSWLDPGKESKTPEVDDSLRATGRVEPPALLRVDKRLFLDDLVLSPRIRAFFRDACGPSGEANRAFPRLRYRATPPHVFTKDDELIVFIGDCHIHLFKCWPCDNFTRPEPGDAGRPFVRTSLIHEFRSIVEHAHASTGDSRRVIQIGDLFEVWESQALYEQAYDVLREMMIGMPEQEVGDELRAQHTAMERHRLRWLREPFPHHLLSRPGHYFQHAGGMDSQRTITAREEARRSEAGADGQRPFNRAQVAIPKYFDMPSPPNPRAWRKCASPADVLALLVYAGRAPGRVEPKPYPPLPSEAANEPLDFTASLEVERRIRRMYEPELAPYGGFDALLAKFTWIRGNHDTATPNRYLLDRYTTEGASRTARVGGPPEAVTEEDSAALLDDPGRTGRLGPVVYEHGHAFDATNNNKVYDRQFFAGYTLCAGHTRDEFADQASGFIADGKDWIVTQSLREFSYNRARRILLFNSQVLLVVLGHTHVPELQDLRRSLAKVSSRVIKGDWTILAMHPHVHRQAAVDVGRITMQCLQGAVHVETSVVHNPLPARYGYSMALSAEIPIRSARVEPGSPVDWPFPEQWKYAPGSQVNITRIYSLARKSVYRIRMLSHDL